MTEKEILQHKVEGRILTYLHRVKCYYEKSLYKVVGRGLTLQEHIAICDKLVEKGVIKRTFGSENAAILQWIETEQQQG